MLDKFSIENRRYLGSKARLLDFIHKTVNENCRGITSFADIFGGTGNVAWSFNCEKTKIYINDILKSNYYSYLAFFGQESIDKKKLEKIIKSYNDDFSGDIPDNYFSINFSGTYFSKENCLKIGAIREDIESKFKQGLLNDREKSYLITSLIYAMDHIANTVGHYDAFRLGGDLSKKLFLKPLSVGTAKQNHLNEIFNIDANELVKKIKADVVYIDPPYNSRQYCDAYHLLENVAVWDKPSVFGVAKKMKRGKGIKSDYCTQKAPQAFDNLIQNIDAKYIIVSFNNMGEKGAGRSQSKLSDGDILKSLSKKGNVKVFSIAFNQFSAGKTNIQNHQERLFFCECIKSKENYAKSPLNYTGGKFRILNQIIPLFADDDKTFVDLFGGGFNVGANVGATNVIYNDKCDQVQRVIKLIAESDTHKLIDEINSVIQKYDLSQSNVHGYEYYGCISNDGLGRYNKPKYERLKTAYNGLSNSRDKDLLLLVLVFFSFNNQIRFNSKGEFNLPVGKRDFNKSTLANLVAFSSRCKQKNITFQSDDFEHLLGKIDQNCFVYCDPPYFLGTASYNENKGWTEKDEERLLKALERLDSLGVSFALSNLIKHKGKTHTALIDWAERNHFKMHTIKSDYTNSNYQKSKEESESVEVLVTNY